MNGVPDRTNCEPFHALLTMPVSFLMHLGDRFSSAMASTCRQHLPKNMSPFLESCPEFEDNGHSHTLHRKTC